MAWIVPTLTVEISFSRLSRATDWNKAECLTVLHHHTHLPPKITSNKSSFPLRSLLPPLFAFHHPILSLSRCHPSVCRQTGQSYFLSWYLCSSDRRCVLSNICRPCSKDCSFAQAWCAKPYIFTESDAIVCVCMCWMGGGSYLDIYAERTMINQVDPGHTHTPKKRQQTRLDWISY